MIRRHGRGFTLLELVVVVVLVAILAGVVAISLQGDLQRARLTTGLEHVALLDAQARAAARRGRCFVQFEVDAGRGVVGFRSEEPKGNGNRGDRSTTITRGLRIDRLVTRDAVAHGGRLQVTISPLGQSDSFALRIRTAGGQATWLVVLGGSGQVVRLKDDKTVHNEIARLLASSPSAYAG